MQSTKSKVSSQKLLKIGSNSKPKIATNNDINSFKPSKPIKKDEKITINFKGIVDDMCDIDVGYIDRKTVDTKYNTNHLYFSQGSRKNYQPQNTVNFDLLNRSNTILIFRSHRRVIKIIGIRAMQGYHIMISKIKI